MTDVQRLLQQKYGRNFSYVGDSPFLESDDGYLYLVMPHDAAIEQATYRWKKEIWRASTSFLLQHLKPEYEVINVLNDMNQYDKGYLEHIRFETLLHNRPIPRDALQLINQAREHLGTVVNLRNLVMDAIESDGYWNYICDGFDLPNSYMCEDEFTETFEDIMYVVMKFSS